MTHELHHSADSSYIGWGAIFAGSAVALAFSFIMLQFGAAVGLADNLNMSAEDITVVKVLSVAVWVLWIQLMASLVGGYIAGRMRAPVAGASAHESEIRDGAHGLIVWAVSTLAVVVAASAASAFAAIAAGQTGNAGEAEATLTEAMVRLEENAAIIFAFCAAATSLISGVVSWWAATAGGDHRDNNVDTATYLSFRR